jgi:hypothetical protein
MKRLLACCLTALQGASSSALRQRTCVRGGWRAYLHCTSMPSSTPDGGGITECAFCTTARVPLCAASWVSPVDVGPRTHSLCRDVVLSSPGNLGVINCLLLGAEGARLVIPVTSRIPSEVDF